jgi:hypothetical protein
VSTTPKKKLERGMTTIQIAIATREELMELGKKGETYDDIINRLIESAKKK